MRKLLRRYVHTQFNILTFLTALPPRLQRDHLHCQLLGGALSPLRLPEPGDEPDVQPRQVRHGRHRLRRRQPTHVGRERLGAVQVGIWTKNVAEQYFELNI